MVYDFSTDLIHGIGREGNLPALLISLISPAYHPGMAYIPDDISQIPDNHPGFIPASDDERERLTILLHKRLDQIIDQEQQTGISRQDRERLATIHKQVRADLATIRYGATDKTVREIERRYRHI